MGCCQLLPLPIAGCAAPSLGGGCAAVPPAPSSTVFIASETVDTRNGVLVHTAYSRPGTSFSAREKAFLRRRRSLSPQETPTVQFYFGGSPATNLLPEMGGLDSGHDKSRSPPPFPGILESPNLFFSPSGPSSVPLTLHIFFIHVLFMAFVSDIYKSPVPRKWGQMGYTRLCKR